MAVGITKRGRGTTGGSNGVTGLYNGEELCNACTIITIKFVVGGKIRGPVGVMVQVGNKSPP